MNIKIIQNFKLQPLSSTLSLCSVSLTGLLGPWVKNFVITLDSRNDRISCQLKFRIIPTYKTRLSQHPMFRSCSNFKLLGDQSKDIKCFEWSWPPMEDHLNMSNISATTDLIFQNFETKIRWPKHSEVCLNYLLKDNKTP